MSQTPSGVSLRFPFSCMAASRLNSVFSNVFRASPRLAHAADGETVLRLNAFAKLLSAVRADKVTEGPEAATFGTVRLVGLDEERIFSTAKTSVGK